MASLANKRQRTAVSQSASQPVSPPRQPPAASPPASVERVSQSVNQPIPVNAPEGFAAFMAERRRLGNESDVDRAARVEIEERRAREISDGQIASLREQWEVCY